MVEGWKSGRIEKILISLIFVWLRVEKVSLYKFTHIPLLKNNSQLKQNKNDKQPKNKNYVQKKKSCLVKTKKKKKKK